jgi:hypothetical protein
MIARALPFMAMAECTASGIDTPVTAQPCPRISTALVARRTEARSLPCSIVVTSRSVSPKRSWMSHTGTAFPSRRAVCTAGRIGVRVIANGSTSWQWLWMTDITSGRDS